MCCGDNHTMVQTSDGFAFSWGAGKDGQLGLDEMRMETSPVLLEVRLPETPPRLPRDSPAYWGRGSGSSIGG